MHIVSDFCTEKGHKSLLHRDEKELLGISKSLLFLKSRLLLPYSTPYLFAASPHFFFPSVPDSIAVPFVPSRFSLSRVGMVIVTFFFAKMIKSIIKNHQNEPRSLLLY